MMTRNRFLLHTLPLLTGMFTLLAAVAQPALTDPPYKFTGVDSFDSASVIAHGLNDGQIVGTYMDGVGVLHGFLDTGGVITNLDNPLGVRGTSAYAINHGFLDANGTYVTLDAPDAGPSTGRDTYLNDINGADQVVGFWRNDTGTASRIFHAFLATPTAAALPAAPKTSVRPASLGRPA